MIGKGRSHQIRGEVRDELALVSQPPPDFLVPRLTPIATCPAAKLIQHGSNDAHFVICEDGYVSGAQCLDTELDLAADKFLMKGHSSLLNQLVQYEREFPGGRAVIQA